MLEREIRDFSTVMRWTIVRSIHRQSIGEHSHAVAIYADQIARFFKWGGDYGALMRYALWHDTLEIASGDAPGPYKRMVERHMSRDELDRLRDAEIALMRIYFADQEWLCENEEVYCIIKMADTLDEMFWLLTEKRLGNGTLTSLTDQAMFRVHRAFDKLPFIRARKDEFWSIVMDAITEHREGQFRIVGEKHGAHV